MLIPPEPIASIFIISNFGREIFQEIVTLVHAIQTDYLFFLKYTKNILLSELF